VRTPGAVSPTRESLAGWNSPRSKVTWPELKYVSIRKMRVVDLEWVNIRALTIVVSGLNFTRFLLFNAEGIAVHRLSISVSIPEIFTVKLSKLAYTERAVAPWGGSTCAPITFLLVDQIHQFCLFNSSVILLDNAVNRWSMSQSVPEIFAVKLESSSTSRRILDVFAFPNFKGAVPPKVVSGLTTPLRGTSRGKVSWV